MNKEIAHKVWHRCLGLAINNSSSLKLPNPVMAFTTAVKAGEYDAISDAEYDDLVRSHEQIGFGIWHGAPELSAGEVLINALTATDIQPDQLDSIVEILAESSAHTDYLSKPEPVPDVNKPESLLDKKRREREQIEACKSIRLYDWSPKDIESFLHTDGGIVQQDAAVRAASIILHNHFFCRSSVNLFCGPSGSGKTEIWRVLQKEIAPSNINVVILDGSTLGASGWRGGVKLADVFKNIDPAKREKVVVVIDEADKLFCEPQYGSGGTDYSKILQNQMLKLLEGDLVYMADEDKGKGFYVDAKNITFVLCGAFQTLLERKSRNTSSMGFGAKVSKTLDYSNTEITTDDLIQSGMRREIASRITRITCMEPLSDEALFRIGKLELDKLSEIMDAPVSIDDDALVELAYAAKDKGLGARWLKSSLRNLLDDLIYEDPEAGAYHLQYTPQDADRRRQAETY